MTAERESATDWHGYMRASENEKNRNICKIANERAREEERKTEREGKRDSASDRETMEREREERRRVCTRDRARGRKIVGVRATQIECVQRAEEAGEGEERYAGAREYVTGMARGQLTFIILTLMDYLIPYIPTDPSFSLRYVSRHPPQSSAKYRIIFMDVFWLMHQGVRRSNNEPSPRK